jgi:hypothetical protein
MGEVDWHLCRFLESSENLKPLVKTRFGIEPSTSVAREIAACLQQGRLFYEAAESSPLEIRPLQMFYGMVGFSKALVIASRAQTLSTLRHAHGLTDVSQGNSRIAELRLRIGNYGTFQEFNDVVADLTRVCYIDNQTRNHAIYLPSTKSLKLTGTELSLREILSRIPALRDLYRMTFGEVSQTESFMFQQNYRDDSVFEIRVDDPELFRDRESLKRIVDRWRLKFPFLATWRLTEAAHAWGNSVIIFNNRHNSGIDEFSESYLDDLDGRFQALAQADDGCSQFSPEEGLSPMAGGFPGPGGEAISPINGHFLSESSLQYLALFLLSSLVRYRPQTWMHAISRSAMPETPADDKTLSLIERFLDHNIGAIPTMVVTVLNPSQDRYA